MTTAVIGLGTPRAGQLRMSGAGIFINVRKLHRSRWASTWVEVSDAGEAAMRRVTARTEAALLAVNSAAAPHFLPSASTDFLISFFNVGKSTSASCLM